MVRAVQSREGAPTAPKWMSQKDGPVIFFLALFEISSRVAVIRDSLSHKMVCLAKPSEPNNRSPFLVILPFGHPPSQGDMEVYFVEEQQSSSGSRNLKRPRVDDDQGEGPEIPTEKCRRHPSLYLEDGNVVLRCEE